MKICSITQDNEILISTMRDADYIDAVTPSVPTNSIIIDSTLPKLDKNKALKIKGARNEKAYYTSSANVEIVDDFRNEKGYSTENGQVLEIKDLGELPSNVTLTPRPSEYHTFKSGKWVITKADADRKKNDEAKTHNQRVFEKMAALELRQNRPIREEKIALKAGNKRAAQAALARIETIDDEINELRKQLKNV